MCSRRSREPSRPARDALVVNSYRGGFGIRQGDWKLLMFQGGGGIGWSPFDFDRDQPYGQLYNLREDPAERRNLYAEEPETVERLSRELRRLKLGQAVPEAP